MAEIPIDLFTASAQAMLTKGPMTSFVVVRPPLMLRVRKQNVSHVP